MLLETRLAARIRDNLAWDALTGVVPAAPGTGASPWQILRRVWATPDDEFVRGVYHAVLGREPDESGFAEQLRVLRAGTPRAHLVRDVAASDEAAARGADTSWHGELRALSPEGIWAVLLGLWPRPAVEFVRGVYDLLLRRPADPDGLAGCLGRLADGGDRAEVIRGIAETVEFCTAGTDGSWRPRLRLLTPDGLRDRLVALFGEPDESFVRGLYDAVLHRPPTPADMTMYLGALAGGATRPAVVRDFLTSAEAAGRYSGPAWAAALGPFLADPDPVPPPVEPAPPAGESTSHDPDASWLTDPDPAGFVRGAYRAIVGREPTPGEVAGRVRKLRFVPLYSRNRLLNSLARSWEAQLFARRDAAEQARAADRAHRQADTGFARTADRLAELAEHLTRLERKAVEPDGDARHAAALLEELHREVRTSRHQLYAVLDLAGRIPEGFREQLHRMEIGIASPASFAEVVERITELRDATEELAADQRQVRRFQPRLRAAGRELLGGQKRLLDGLQHAAAARQHATDLLRQVAGGQEQLRDRQRELVAGHRQALEEQARLTERVQHVAAHQERIADGQEHLRDRQRDLVGWQRQTADDQIRLADGMHRLTAEQERLAEVYREARRETAADRFATGVWFDQLRRVGATVAEHLGAKVPAAAPDGPPADRRERCRVCGGELAFKWAGRVLGDRYEARYHECRACQALQVPDPTWLPEAYKQEADPLLWNPDVGRFRRNYTVFCYLRAMAAAGLPAGRLLDYGGGYGLLTQMLADAGADAWTYDPYIGNPFFATDRLIPRLDAVPDQSFDVITAFEVFEHLTEPLAVGAEFRRLLRPGGAVVVSTGLYDPAAHGPDWHYLSPAAGQHVLFWSRGAVRAFAAKFGFQSVGYFPTAGFQCVVLADRPADDLAAILGRSEDRLWDAPFLGSVDRGWVLARPGEGPAAADVEPVGPPPGGDSCAS